MAQIAVLQGVVTGPYANLTESLPVNLEPVLVESGLSSGFLTSPAGISTVATGPGEDRGGINWKGVHYRIMGSKLVTVSGSTITERGDVGIGGQVRMDYSFDRLAIPSGGDLYYWDGAILTQVTDPDLGTVVDLIFADGYFFYTDGTSLVVTEINNPASISPLKYGSSESDPDPVMGLIKIKEEVFALNRYTIECFQNVGGSGFPYQRNTTAMVDKGIVGTYAKAHFAETVAFVGSGRNEALSVYIMDSGTAVPISLSAVDDELNGLTDAEQAAIQVETIVADNEHRLLVHLPNKTLVYSLFASKMNKKPVWHVLADGVLANQAYTGRNAVLVDGSYFVASGDQVGVMDRAVATRFGEPVGWRFDTAYVYNKGGFVVNELEMIFATGLAPLGTDPTVFFSFTKDGRTWSQERAVQQGKFGQRNKRIVWRPMARSSNYMGLRFRGANTSIASIARLEANIVALAQ